MSSWPLGAIIWANRVPMNETRTESSIRAAFSLHLGIPADELDTRRFCPHEIADSNALQ